MAVFAAAVAVGFPSHPEHLRLFTSGRVALSLHCPREIPDIAKARRALRGTQNILGMMTQVGGIVMSEPMNVMVMVVEPVIEGVAKQTITSVMTKRCGQIWTMGHSMAWNQTPSCHCQLR